MGLSLEDATLSRTALIEAVVAEEAQAALRRPCCAINAAARPRVIAIGHRHRQLVGTFGALTVVAYAVECPRPHCSMGIRGEQGAGGSAVFVSRPSKRLPNGLEAIIANTYLAGPTSRRRVRRALAGQVRGSKVGILTREPSVLAQGKDRNWDELAGSGLEIGRPRHCPADPGLAPDTSRSRTLMGECCQSR